MLSRVDPLAPFSRWYARAFAGAWEGSSAREAVLSALQCRRMAVLHAQRERAADRPQHAAYYREEAQRLRGIVRGELRRARALRAQPVRQPYLLIACSDTKRHDAQPLRAIDRYDGPAYRVLRNSLPVLGNRLPMRILSAQFGLISAQTCIPDYNRRMDEARAQQFLDDDKLRRDLAADIARVRPTDILVMGGAHYRRVLTEALRDAGLPVHVRVLAVQGGIGEQLGQLRRWLHNQSVTDTRDVRAAWHAHLSGGQAAHAPADSRMSLQLPA
ncbi:DUF6884 domain-containing protein [Cupriavidus sp. TMH.W2]|uniref:DUF6884 domain-containing protein n=1 Tax=Cupriavidus sp. TMH.W2 TaxID=3434465 RepID=UPI003D779E50